VGAVNTPAALRARPSRGQRWPTGKAGSAAFWVGGARVGGVAGEHAVQKLFGNAN